MATLQEWMQHQRYDGVAINLDPGAEAVPYQAAIDVREKFTLNLQFVLYEKVLFRSSHLKL